MRTHARTVVSVVSAVILGATASGPRPPARRPPC